MARKCKHINKDIRSLELLKEYISDNNNTGELDVARKIINDWLKELK